MLVLLESVDALHTASHLALRPTDLGPPPRVWNALTLALISCLCGLEPTQCVTCLGFGGYFIFGRRSTPRPAITIILLKGQRRTSAQTRREPVPAAKPAWTGPDSVASLLGGHAPTSRWLGALIGDCSYRLSATKTTYKNATTYGPTKDDTMPSSPKIRPNALNSSRCRSISKIARIKKRTFAAKIRIGDAEVSAMVSCADFRLLAGRWNEISQAYNLQKPCLCIFVSPPETSGALRFIWVIAAQ
jgi:hypothetical protein